MAGFHLAVCLLKWKKFNRRTWGVWHVRDETDLIDEAPDYVWGARVDAERLALSGYVPNEKTRRRIMGIVRDRFPEAQINDDMLPARGVPGEAVWIEGIDFGLRQLSGLKQGGQVELQGTRFTISGEAKARSLRRWTRLDL